MSIRFDCEHCRKSIKAPDEAGGQRGKCPHCGLSNYIPAPVSEEDIIPLAPLDDQEEQTLQQQRRKLLEQDLHGLAEGEEPTLRPPLEQQENLTSEDLHHFVVNYLLNIMGSKLEQAEVEVEKLKRFRKLGRQAVEDFQSGQVTEPALNSIPPRLREGLLKQLAKELK